jgi:hypothetical protein
VFAAAAGAPTSDCSTSTTLRPRVIEKPKQAEAKQQTERAGIPRGAADRNDLFGEQLPAGLRLANP